MPAAKTDPETETKADPETVIPTDPETAIPTDPETAIPTDPENDPEDDEGAETPFADVLRARIAQIEESNNGLRRDLLLYQLRAEAGRIDTSNNGITTVHLDGVKVQTTAGVGNALSAWCQKARLALLNGQAV